MMLPNKRWWYLWGQQLATLYVWTTEMVLTKTTKREGTLHTNPCILLLLLVQMASAEPHQSMHISGHLPSSILSPAALC